MTEKLITYPVRINSLLTNPGIGFIAAPGLMHDDGVICDNRGNQVKRYQFTPNCKTFNHPDSKVYYCGVRWKEIEVRKGEYHWEVLENKLEYAKSLGCTAIVRCSPYALDEEDDIPAWFRSEWKEEPEFPFWKVDPNISPYASYWSTFIREFAKRFDGHPIISSIDMAIVGAWGEGGGTEFVDIEKIQCIVDAYIDGFKITPLQALLHDPKSIGLIRDRREKIGFRVDCLGDMGGFHGVEWSHMEDFYPENICNFHMERAWEKAPIVFEACWHMNDWYLQGWDIDYIIEESLKWHISSFNSKGTTVPEAWMEKVKQWVNRMGYRFELRKFICDKVIEKEQKLHVSALWANMGVAPIYHNYPLVIRLKNESGCHTLLSKVDIRSWLPDLDLLWEEEFVIPSRVKAGEYELLIGIETGIEEIGNVKLAITGEEDGYYKMGNIIINEGGACLL